MKPARRPALWVRPFLSVARVLVRLYPADVADVVGDEIVDMIRLRLEQCAERAGFGPAFWLGIAELSDLLLSGFEARRELTGGVRLGSSGLVGVDVYGAIRVLGRDVQEALRGLARTPGHTAMVVALIGVGVGASASIFGVVDDVLIEPLPFEEPSELVHVWADRPWLGEERGLLADVQVQDIEQRAQSVEAIAALWMVSGRVIGADRPMHTDVARVSSDFFDILGVDPLMGRSFREGEDLPGADWVAMLTFDAWQRDFGGDPDVVGRTVEIGWYGMEVIGVLPRDFRFVVPDELGAHDVPDLWIPWRHHGNPESRVGGGTLAAVARLAPGVTHAQAAEELTALAGEEDALHYDGRGFGYSVQSLHDEWVTEARPGLLLLGAAVLVLFLIAVANASTLLLTHTQVRRAELGLRRVMGASAARLSRLLGIEALVIALLAGWLGYIASFGGAAALRELAPPELPLLHDGGSDLTVLLFAIVGSVAASLVAIGVPLLRQARVEPAAVVVAGAGSTRTESRRAGRTRSLLVMTQVAFSVVLLVTAGLLVRTFASVRGADLGFAETNRITFSVYLMDDYDTHPARVDFYDELRTRLRSIEGVSAASGTSALPLTDGAPQAPVSTFRRERDVDPRSFFLTEGFSLLLAQELDGERGDGWTLADLTAAHPGYFEAIGARLLAGRSIDDRDGMTAEPVVVIDELLSRHLWAGTDAVGQKLWVAGAWREVVGVVAHARMGDVRSEARPQAYLPHSQVQSGRVSMVVQTERPVDDVIADVRAEVAEIDPLVPIADVRTVERLLGDAEARDRFGMTVMTTFAMLATVLVALGLYGTLSFAVGERSREIAVRRVVGSGRLSSAWIVTRVALRTVGGGLVIGLLGAVATGRAVAPLLYGVSPTDAATLVLTSLVVMLVALAACWAPASRAMNADPVEVLRVG